MKKKFKNEAGNITLEIAEDSFSAYLTIEKDEYLNEKDILELLQEAGIKYGIEEAAEFIEQKNIEKDFGTSFPIAIGKPSSEPQIEFSLLFDKENSFDPENFENEFKKLKHFERIKKEEPLAHLFITKESKPGKNIFGKEVGSDLSNDKALENHLGDNVYYSQDRSQIIAEADGYPYLDDLGRVCVKSSFNIDNDIGLNYENFELFGNLTVNGDIKEKIQINVTGNMTVNGDVNDVKLRIDGNLKINGDILNCKINDIRVNGNVEFGAADNSNIYAAKTIRFLGRVQYCHLVADKDIIGSEESSAIIGGLVQSGDNVEVAVIGSSNVVGTEVEITISPYVKEELLAVTKKIMNLKSKEDKQLQKINKLREKQQMLESSLEQNINETLLNEEVTPKHILVFKKIFHGTYLRILKKSKTIAEELEKVSFSVVEGELVIDSY